VQLKCVIFVAQVLIERRDNLDKAAHDVGEESHAAQQDPHAQEHFVVGLGRKVTVAYRRERREREVAGGERLVQPASVIEMVCLEESVPLTLEETRPEEEEASEEVHDQDG